MNPTSHHPDILSVIEKLAQIASDTRRRHSLDLRLRATLALTMFLPSPIAKGELGLLADSKRVPSQVRSVVAEALDRKI